jgi:hypothetical protein
MEDRSERRIREEDQPPSVSGLVMIFRLSQKLNDKIKAGTLAARPLNENSFADWSAHLFVADRTQYILLSNTKSLYSTVMYAKGVTNDSRFIDRAFGGIREFMEQDGQAFVYHRFIAPASGEVRFAKALDRSVTGSMNDLVFNATICLTEGELSPFDVGFKLNETPFSSLEYSSPRKVFKLMATSAPLRQRAANVDHGDEPPSAS